MLYVYVVQAQFLKKPGFRNVSCFGVWAEDLDVITGKISGVAEGYYCFFCLLVVLIVVLGYLSGGCSRSRMIPTSKPRLFENDHLELWACFSPLLEGNLAHSTPTRHNYLGFMVPLDRIALSTGRL